MRFTLEYNEEDKENRNIVWMLTKIMLILPYATVDKIDKDITYEHKIQFTNVVELINEEFTKELWKKMEESLKK